MFGRAKVAMLVGEFLGVATLTSVVLAVANSQIGFPLFVAASAGLTVGAMTLVVGSASGAHLNPAITAGLWSIKKISTTEAIAYIASQLLGAVAALSLFQYLTDRALTSLAGKEFDWRVFASEAIGTFVFAFGFAAAVSVNEARDKAVIVGSSLALGIVVASTAANGFLNPAVATGANSVSWVYVLAPVAGSLVGMNLYAMLFAPGGKGFSLPALSGSKSSSKKRTSRRR